MPLSMTWAQPTVSSDTTLPEWMQVFREISVVIASSDGEKVIPKALATLYASQAPWREVIVVCDGSETDYLAEFPKVKVVQRSEQSLLESINQGFEMAQGTWVLSLDADSEPDIGTWEGLCRILKSDPDADVISFSIVSKYRQNLKQLNRASLMDAGNFYRSGALLKRSSLQHLGGFDSELSEWGAELHWSARALHAGRSLLHCPEACVIHRAIDAQKSVEQSAYICCCNLLLLGLRYAPARRWRKLMQRRIRDVLVYSVMHRTSVYVRALREALRLWKAYPEKIDRLSETHFRQLAVSWAAPYRILD